MVFPYPKWQEWITKQPGTFRKTDVASELLVGHEKAVTVCYAPLDYTNADARVVFVGLTPGWQQAERAYVAFRDARRDGLPPDLAMKAAKAEAAFAGMRKRLCGWLDALELPRALSIPDSSSLFASNAKLLHTTSLVRYPVFVGEALRNYTGHSPKPLKSDLLMSVVQKLLVPEIAALGDAIVVPMGVPVAATLRAIGVDSQRCLYGFPHPSGANGHGPRQFTENLSQMRAIVATWG
jgi:Uracil DNA glycosylase superfamily